jgi:hypothetical protein
MKLSRKSFHYYIAKRYGMLREGHVITISEYIFTVLFGQLVVTFYGLMVWVNAFVIMDPFLFNNYAYDYLHSLPVEERSGIMGIWLGLCIIGVLLFNAIRDKLRGRFKKPDPIIVEFTD